MMNCTIEIESLAASGGNDVRQCDQDAVWIISSSIEGDKFGPAAYRCWEHAGGTVDFLMTERGTDRILMVRV